MLFGFVVDGLFDFGGYWCLVCFLVSWFVYFVCLGVFWVGRLVVCFRLLMIAELGNSIFMKYLICLVLLLNYVLLWIYCYDLAGLIGFFCLFALVLCLVCCFV